MEQHTHEMIASVRLLNLITQILLYVKSNSSKYEPNITAALHMPYT
jgi:hypothetical protein